eukprot:scaffold27052_cov169-Skeletonema_menzelii.AAC.4
MAAALPSGYRLSASIKEAHEHPIYCVSFSPADHKNEVGGSNKSALKYFSTCAGQFVHIYEVDMGVSDGVNKQEKRIMVRQVFCDVDDEEEFYTCAFGSRGITEGKSNAPNNKSKAIYFGGNQCKRSKGTKRQRKNDEDNSRIHDLSQRQGPPLLCVAGKRGIIKVIDTVLQSLVMTLLGHGDSVNDLKCCPTNESLLLSASKDHSIRLWNLQHGHMIAIFAGHDGHRGEVLSLSWHYSGTKFASSAFDNTIKLWNVSDKLTTGQSENIQAAIRKSFEMEHDDKFKTVIEQTPYFATDSIHDLPGCVGTNEFVYFPHVYCKLRIVYLHQLNFISSLPDCVQFVGDLILSKSVQNVVVLWQPVVTNEDFQTFNTIYPNYINEDRKNNDRIKSKVIFLRDFNVSNCDNWFIRFGSSSPYNEILAMGNQNGEVKFWKLMGSEDDNDEEYFDVNEGLLCKLKTGGSTVRMVAIAGTECIVAVCDDSSIWMFEALEE